MVQCLQRFYTFRYFYIWYACKSGSVVVSCVIMTALTFFILVVTSPYVFEGTAYAHHNPDTYCTNCTIFGRVVDCAGGVACKNEDSLFFISSSPDNCNSQYPLRNGYIFASVLLILCRIYLIRGCVAFLVKCLCIYNLVKAILAFSW